MDEMVKMLVDEIHKKYKRCLVIVCDSTDIPETLMELLDGKVICGLNCSNLEATYQNYKQGKYNTYKFMCAVEKLFIGLVEQFDDFVDILLTGNTFNYKEELNYERS